jgi:dephospho-CoA kinase
MKKIGITGGIGSGKTTVARYLASLGYIVIDADEIARNLSISSQDLIMELKNEFGETILNNDKSLNRKELAKIVFNDKEKKLKLDNIFHPRIKDQILDVLNSLEKETNMGDTNRKSIVFLDAPLIFEANLQKLLDKVWVVDSVLEDRVKRISIRDNISNEDIYSRINSQMDSENKILLADEIIYNNSSLEDLKARVDELLAKESK